MRRPFAILQAAAAASYSASSICTRRVGRSRPDYDPVAERVLLSLLDGGGL